ncbi:hypothetical protein KUTeg_011559, partial [Tegillarca granosa]
MQPLLETYGAEETIQFTKWERVKYTKRDGKEVTRVMPRSHEKSLNSVMMELTSELDDNLTKDGNHMHYKRTLFFVKSNEIERNRLMRATKTLKGTRKLHSIKSVGEPQKVQVRNLSCFCTSCLCNNFDLCENKQYVQKWQTVVLKSAIAAEPVNQVMPVQNEQQDQNSNDNETEDTMPMEQQDQNGNDNETEDPMPMEQQDQN